MGVILTLGLSRQLDFLSVTDGNINILTTREYGILCIFILGYERIAHQCSHILG